MVLFDNRVAISIDAVDNFSRVFRRAGKTMSAFSRNAIAMGAVGGGIALGFKKAITASMDFETAFTGVRKTVDLTEAGFADLEQRFKNITKTTPVTFVELSRIGEIAGQLGVEGVNNLEKFTKTIADISVTTNLTAESAATSFARLSNIMGEPLDNIDRMGSAVVGLGNNFATTEQEIVDMSLRLAGAGKTVGLSTPEILGMSAALSALGIRSELGGSAVSRTMIKIAKAVSNGGMTINELAKKTGMTGDELNAEFNSMQSDVRNFAEVSGMSVEDFSKAWKEKPVDAMGAVIMGLKDVSESGGNTFGILEDLDLKSIRITDTMLRLANSEDGLSSAVDLSNKAWEENVALTEEADKRYDTFQSQVDIVKNKFALLGDEIGDRLIPILKDYLIPAIDKLISFWNNLSPTTQNIIIMFAGVTSAVMLLAAAIGILVLVSSPLLLVLLGIAVIITALILLWKHWDAVILAGTKKMLWAAGVMDKTWELVKDGFEIAWTGIKNIFFTVWNAIISGYEWGINLIIKGINKLISGYNNLPFTRDISFVAKMDFSGAKKEITDIGDLMANQKQARAFRAEQFAIVADKLYEGIAEKQRLAAEEKNITVINIENLQATDAESVAETLEDVINLK